MPTTIKLYSASELKEEYPEGFENAFEKWKNSQDEIFWMDETIESLKAIIRASGLNLVDYSIGAYGYSYIRVNWRNDDTAELSGNRALAWLENHLLSGLRKNKPFLSRVYRDKTGKIVRGYDNKPYVFTRYGKIPECPFTGYFADMEYLDSLIKDIKAGCTLRDAYNNLADVCSHLLEQELESQMSEEYFIDHADANEFQFTEDGQRVY